MNPAALLLSYLAVFVAGMATGELLVPRAVGWVSRLAHSKGSTMSETAKGRAWGLIVVLALGVVGVGLGVMLVLDSRAEKRAAEDRADLDRQLVSTVECLNEWGTAFDKALAERVKVTAKLRRAEEARARAFDRLVNAAARASRQPPESTPGEFREVIEAANQTSRRAEQVRADTDVKLSTTPYPAPPALTCSLGQ